MRILNLLCFVLLIQLQEAYSQVTPNSNRFEVKNYIAINSKGKYIPYYAHGFVENVGNGSSPKIFIMPLLELDLNSIKYIDSRGVTTTSSSDNIYSISIPISADLSLPNESQKVAIAASLTTGSTLHYYMSPIAKNAVGGPLVSDYAGPYTTPIITQANQYEELLRQQQGLINSYNQYRAEIISLSEYEIIVKVGNETVYDESFSGTLISMGSTINDISIDRPTEYVKNRIAEGNFTILIKYKFKDSRGSYINARIDAGIIINQFLNESYQSVVSQRSSGWSFLGFGSRRQSIKSHFDSQVSQQYTDQRYSNTTIEMYDADDQMLAMFEDAFFPTITKQKAIENHIAAAEKAKLSGNTELQKLHLDYVNALKANNPDLETNTGAALASLAKNDFVGFIANGVRWGDYSASGNNSFRRILNSSEMTSMVSTWSQTKKISVQHAVSQKVALAKEVELKAHLGLLNFIPFQANLYISNGYTALMKNVKGIILGPITEGGSLLRSNVIPGTPLTKVGYNNVFDLQTLTDALSSLKPGDDVNITILTPVGNAFEEKRVRVTLGAYPK